MSTQAIRPSRAIRTLQGHLAAIQSGEVTKTNVIGLRKALNLAERTYHRWCVPAYVTGDWLQALGDCTRAINEAPPRIIGELHDTGLAVLRNPRYRKRWGPSQRDVIEDFDHFKLIGFDYIGRRGEYATPVYRACARGGLSGKPLSFDFRNIPWQSGGNGPEVRGFDRRFGYTY